MINIICYCRRMDIITYLRKSFLHVIDKNLRHKRCGICCYSF
nr:MAG TPA: hypothetical protein [Caudoviricetes sp.]DAP66364.1 MAG TPA: hypothetical protein [Caudoviricetes sp.]